MSINRRDFLGRTAAAAAFASVNARAMHQSNSEKQRRVACNSWPFRGYFDTPKMHEYRDPKDPLLTVADFPEFLADHFDIHNVEFLSPHFVDSDPDTIAKVKAGLKKAKSRCCNIMDVHLPGGVYNPSADRQAMAKEADRWVGVAIALGSPSITIPLGGEGPVDAHTAAHNLGPSVDVAHKRGIRVLFHNDDIRRESAEILVAVIKQLGPERTGTCPDFGNFATRSAAYALSQLRMLAPYAHNICHSKDGIANNGRFHADDFPASMKVMHDDGFHGVYSLEFEGLGNPIDGVRKLMQLTERYMD